MFCANCQSDKLQKLSLVHESGITHSSGAVGGVGVGVGVGMGGIGIGVGGGTTSGISVNATARRAAPPARRTTSGSLWFAICAIAVVIAIVNHAWVVAAIFAGFGVWAIFTVRTCNEWNRTEFPRLWATWDAAYLCLRCGTMAAPLMAPAAAVTTIEHPEIPVQARALDSGPNALSNEAPPAASA
ncbi:MAG TPA: hypothetical protein VK760_12850 [Candidatus Acidoferrales bacterium]|jgi:hypothetical protein|nr:hypothetical protein [Candidatus Acidoferrales bacterium]